MAPWRPPQRRDVTDAVSAGTLSILDDFGTIAAAVIVNHDFDPFNTPINPWMVDCPASEAAIVHVLATAPEYRGTGIAHELLIHVIDTLRSQNMRTVRLEVAAYNTPAVKLYESCGFIPIIVTRRCWGGVMTDAIAMELPLI